MTLRQMGSLDVALKVGNGDGSIVMDLMVDHNNQPALDALDWQLGANALTVATYKAEFSLEHWALIEIHRKASFNDMHFPK